MNHRVYSELKTITPLDSIEQEHRLARHSGRGIPSLRSTETLSHPDIPEPSEPGDAPNEWARHQPARIAQGKRRVLCSWG